MISILMSRKLGLILLTSQATSTYRQRTLKDLSRATISRASSSSASQAVSKATVATMQVSTHF